MTSTDIHYVTPEKTYTSATRGEHPQSNFSVALSFINNTSFDVFVKTDNGFAIKIAHTNNIGGNFQAEHFIVRVTYSFTNIYGIRNAIEFLEGERTRAGLSAELQQLYTTLVNTNTSSGMNNFHAFNIDYPIDSMELAAKHPIFVKEANVLVASTSSVIQAAHHPRSVQGEMIDSYRQQQTDVLQAGISVRVVDNHGIAAVRYMYSCRQIVTVPCVRDVTKDHGVYVTRVVPNKMGILEIHTETLSFEEAEAKIGLFKSINEALTHGDPSRLIDASESEAKARIRAMDIELVELRQSNERQRAEWEREKFELEREARLREEQADELKRELDHLRALQESHLEHVNRSLTEASVLRKDIREAKTDRRKNKVDKKSTKAKKKSLARQEKYEEKSTRRKNQQEFIKHVPVMLLGTAAIAAATYKIMSSSNKGLNNGIV